MQIPECFIIQLIDFGEMITIKVKKLNNNAKLPTKAHSSDFCYDCVAITEEEIAPNVWKYGLGLSFEIDRQSCYFAYNDLNLSIDARPRSSIWKTGMILSNCVGTIDEDYRGEVCAIFYHVFPDRPRYKIGDKIIQIKLGEAESVKFKEVRELSSTERGSGGFGSTGN